MSVEQLMLRYQTENDARSSNILSSIVQYYKSKGEIVSDIPIFDEKILDVSALFLKTAEKGGCPEDGGSHAFWSSMCNTLEIGESHLTALRSFYMNYLFLYERQLRLFKKKQQAQRLLANQQASQQSEQTNASSTAPSTTTMPTPAAQSAQSQVPRLPSYEQANQQQHLVAQSATGIVTLPQNRPPQQQQQLQQQQIQQQQQQQYTQAQLAHMQQNPAQQAPVLQQKHHQHLMQQQQQQMQQHQHQQQMHHQQQPVPYVKPKSQYMLKKEQRTKEAAAAAALLPPSMSMSMNMNIPVAKRPIQPGLSTPAPPITNDRMVPTNNMSAQSGIKYRPPVPAQQQPVTTRPQTVQQQHVPVSIPIQHVPYVPPAFVGPIFVRENLPESAWPKKILESIKELGSKDPTVVLKGLNTLLMKSFESDIGITLQIENYPDLLPALGTLLDVLNPLANILFLSDSASKQGYVGSKRKIDDVSMENGDRNNSANIWTTSLPCDGNQLFKVRT